MKECLIFNAICWSSVWIAAFFGFSEGAGLFGAITTGGTFILLALKDKQ